MENNKKIYSKGFTLIELLVVIAIIAILSTVVMAGLNSARAKGRDAKRLSDIKAVQAALELFYDSCNGYPVETGGTILATGAASGASLGPNTPCPAPGSGVFSQFMNPLPLNPTPNGANYVYTAATSATYTITFSLEGAAGSLASGAHTASPSGIL